jgi:Protein of unknown function (DUF1576)
MTDAAAIRSTNPAPMSDRAILLLVAGYALAFIVFGLAIDGPAAVAKGLVAIVTSRDTLLTDYFGIGGIGAGCVNAGLLTLCACLVYDRTGAKITGASVACLFLVLGFALFGKNLLNIWPIVLGVALYSRFKGETFATHINTAFFGVALAPIFSEILFSGSLAAAVSVPLAVATGLVIGFILPPAAAQLAKAHMGFSLYNMGFTAGLVGTLVVALYKSYGFVPDPVFVWTTGNNLLLGSFLALVFVSMIAIGFACDRGVRSGLRKVIATTGQSPTDFIAIAGVRQHGTVRRDRHGLHPGRGGRAQRPGDRRDLHHRGVRGVRKASAQHRADHGRRVPGLAGEAVERRRSVDPARRTLRNDAGADRRALRVALGRGGRVRALVRGADGGPAACRPQPVQQRLRRRHRRVRPRAGHHRHPVPDPPRGRARIGDERHACSNA